jgi:hypothetical protein
MDLFTKDASDIAKVGMGVKEMSKMGAKYLLT